MVIFEYFTGGVKIMLARVRHIYCFSRARVICSIAERRYMDINNVELEFED